MADGLTGASPGERPARHRLPLPGRPFAGHRRPDHQRRGPHRPSRLLARVSAHRLLTAGLLLIAAGRILAATLDVDDRAPTSLMLPLGLIGTGFAFTVSSITATAMNSTPSPRAPHRCAARAYALDGLGHGYSIGFVVCGSAALFAALLVLLALHTGTEEEPATDEVAVAVTA